MQPLFAQKEAESQSSDDESETSATKKDDDEKQCRICLQVDGEDPDLGRLIRPCLCKGSMSVSMPSTDVE